MTRKKFNRVKGNIGEAVSIQELQKKDYAIITKNFSNRFGEIDIIVAKENTIIFVEVKTKVEEIMGTPEEMINGVKLKKIYQTADAFLLEYKKYQNWKKRIDVCSVVLSKNQEVLRFTHYENVNLESI